MGGESTGFGGRRERDARAREKKKEGDHLVERYTHHNEHCNTVLEGSLHSHRLHTAALI